MLKSNTKSKISDSAFVADNATIIGDVTVDKNASVWFNAVLRGDIGRIHIGETSNIQDFVMVHVPDGGEVMVGKDVTVGHRALLHGCKIGSSCLIGMGAIIMDKAEIGDNSVVAAGSVVTQNTKIPPNSMVMGIPAKVKRSLKTEEVDKISKSAIDYYKLSRSYLEK